MHKYKALDVAPKSGPYVKFSVAANDLPRFKALGRTTECYIKLSPSITNSVFVVGGIDACAEIISGSVECSFAKLVLWRNHPHAEECIRSGSLKLIGHSLIPILNSVHGLSDAQIVEIARSNIKHLSESKKSSLLKTQQHLESLRAECADLEAGMLKSQQTIARLDQILEYAPQQRKNK